MGIMKEITFLPVKTRGVILCVTSHVRSPGIGVRGNFFTDGVCSVL